MTASTIPQRRSTVEVGIPAVASVAWIGVAVLLFADITNVAVLIAPLLLAVAATSLAVVGFVRRRSSGKPNGALVAGLLSPAIALAAMTPLFAVVGVVVFAVFALVMAVETAVLAIIGARGLHRA